MAIRYRDSHAGGIFSSAVARDSKGEWFESDHHFCGQFKLYAISAQRQSELRKEFEERGVTDTIDLLSSFGDLHRLATSPDLEIARTNLLALGFRKMAR